MNMTLMDISGSVWHVNRAMSACWGWRFAVVFMFAEWVNDVVMGYMYRDVR